MEVSSLLMYMGMKLNVRYQKWWCREIYTGIEKYEKLKCSLRNSNIVSHCINSHSRNYFDEINTITSAMTTSRHAYYLCAGDINVSTGVGKMNNLLQ